MNKIQVDKKVIFLTNNYYKINISEESFIDITIPENHCSKLIIIGSHDYKINFLLEKNSELKVYSLNKNNSVDIRVLLKENSKVTYHHSVACEEISDNTFEIIHQENNSSSYLYNNGINLCKGKLFFRIDGKISKNLEKIICNQASQIINFNDGNSKIIPNLIIDSNDIIANHSSYIGNINDEVSFYLESRGIRKEEIRKLIFKAVLLGKMELGSEKDDFNKIINEWGGLNE